MMAPLRSAALSAGFANSVKTFIVPAMHFDGQVGRLDAPARAIRNNVLYGTSAPFRRGAVIRDLGVDL